MANNAQLQASLEAIDAKLTEASVEIPAELEKLRALIEAGTGTTPAQDALIESLTAKGTALADVVPNAVPTP